MGGNISCVCAQPAETKFQVEETRRERIMQKAIETARPIRTRKKKKQKKMKLQELPPELMVPSLARTYLMKRCFDAARILRKFSQSHRLLFTPLPVRPEIELLEAGLPQFSVKSISSTNLKFIPALALADGGFYEGQWDIALQKQEGSGVRLYSDHSKYTGYFHEGKRNLQGRHVKLDGDIYEGEFDDDRMQGKGMLIRNNGMVYTGDFEKDLESGKGILEQNGKVVYVGDFLKGMKHGKGKMTMLDGNVFEGQFAQNTMTGYGKYEWTDGRSFNGQWKNNKPHGDGTYIWPDGRKYVGFYQDGHRHGYGEFWWPDGREYKGDWVKGKMHGEGFYSFTDSNGVRQSLKSAWVNGRREKWLTIGNN
jgi:hypothetical protein